MSSFGQLLWLTLLPDPHNIHGAISIVFNLKLQEHMMKVYPKDELIQNPIEIIDKTKPSLHKTLRFVLLLAQCFGQLPVTGINGPDVRSLYFTWKSWRVIYCLVSCSGTIFVAVLHLYKMLIKGADLFIISAFVFYCNIIFGTLFFLQLAKNWPKLMSEWHLIELSMRSYGWPQQLNLRINITTAIVAVMAAVQGTTNLISQLINANKCKQNGQSVAEYFYTVVCFEHVFTVIGYSPWIGVLLQIIDLLTSFTWYFMDLFIMVMSSALAVRFRQVTTRLRTAADKMDTRECAWKSLRNDYTKLCKLCKMLDEAISYIVLLSFAGNLFFILIQLFNSLRNMKTNLARLYFFLSFGFLILRTVYVSLYGAWINDESKRPVTILNSVSSSVYNLEIRRFIQQISFDSVSLTGRNFFSVTRGLILSIAGAIVTYELVLIQFNENLLRENVINGSSIC